MEKAAENRTFQTGGWSVPSCSVAYQSIRFGRNQWPSRMAKPRGGDPVPDWLLFNHPAVDRELIRRTMHHRWPLRALPLEKKGKKDRISKSMASLIAPAFLQWPVSVISRDRCPRPKTIGFHGSLRGTACEHATLVLNYIHVYRFYRILIAVSSFTSLNNTYQLVY